MTTQTASVPATIASAGAPVTEANKALGVGIAGLALTLVGLFVSDYHGVATSYLVSLVFFITIAIGMLLLVMLHHIFDASWGIVVRRQFEHGLAAMKWLALLFVPLLAASWIGSHDAVWPWMNPDHLVRGVPVGADPIYHKKSAFLNVNTFTFLTAAFFLIWTWFAGSLRKASFSQDRDGDPKWTRMNRLVSAGGIPVMALTLTCAAIYWVKSLEYHWFSTMYGVWYFANCARAALSIGVVMMVWLYRRGDLKGILNTNHFHSIGQLMLAFTVFWGYITFSQYFLIWNANIPEETFWYNLRELNNNGATNQWWYVGLVLVFGHFLVPFCALLSYRYKVTHHIIRRIALWILAIVLIDMCYNALPALKDANGDAQPFLSINLIWVATSVIGVGGICAWAYLRSLASTKIIPVQDPRITECLTYHEA